MLPFRRCAIDFEVPGGGIVPKGTFVGIAASSVHKSDKQYVDSNTYNPDRWITLGNAADSHRSFLSFGAGAHKCPGRMFAIVEMKTILATLLVKYKFSGGTLLAQKNDRHRKIAVTIEKIN